MGLDILPKSGSHFSVSSGAGNFKYKLSRLTANQGGEFGNLRDNQKSIVGAFKKFGGTIKGYGGLSRMQQKAIVRSVKNSDKSLSWDDKKDLERLVGYYGRDNDHGDSGVKKAALEAALKKENSSESEKPTPVPVKVRINRDPNSNLDFGGLRSQVRPGVAARVNRVVSAVQSGRAETSSRPKIAPTQAVSVSQLSQQKASPAASISSDKKSGPPENVAEKKTVNTNNFKLNL